MTAGAMAVLVASVAACSASPGATTAPGSIGAGGNSPGVSAAGSSSPVHLTMWHQWGGGHENDALKAAVTQYEATHPNVTIDVVPLTLTDNAKILTAISGGDPPDIVDLVSSQVLGEWASKGALVPLDDFIKSSGLDTGQYIPAGLRAMTVDGKIYALPFMNFNVGLIYNKRLFQEAGLDPSKPPTTIEELTQDAYKLTKQDANGQITQLGFLPEYPGTSNGQVCTVESAGWLFGGDWYNAATQKVTANMPQNVAALAWEASFYQKYGAQNMANFLQSAGAYLTAQDPLESGKLAMTFDGPWDLAFTKENAPDAFKDLAAARVPAPAAQSELTGTSFLDSNPQAIPAGSKNAAAAFDFISWETTNPTLTASFAQEINALPQLKTVPDFANLHDPNFQVFLNEANSSNAHVWPQLSFSTEYSVKLCEAQAAALYGTKTPQQALDDLQKQIAP
jgi:multiple sugar transport system substrate-binding protein